jgi:hypothetical protein
MMFLKSQSYGTYQDPTNVIKLSVFDHHVLIKVASFFIKTISYESFVNEDDFSFVADFP